MTLAPTPGQTIGPFFHHALPVERGADLVPPGHPRRVRLHGFVLDGADAPVPDALVEVRQTDGEGNIARVPGSLRRDSFTFTGWGRVQTDREGRYSFSTVAPGPAGPGEARFFSLCIFARGVLDRLFTRAYLFDDGLADDPLLSSLSTERKETLVATPDDHGYRFDIRLQGPGETVFLNHRLNE